MGRNSNLDKSWELDLAEKLFTRRIELMIADGKVQHAPYTQRSVSNRLGVTAVCLHNWEYGKNLPNDWGTWKKWANALDVDFEIIIKPRSTAKEIAARNIQRIFEDT